MGPEKEGLDDLVEFYNQWPDLRAKVIDILDGPALQQHEKSILRSMIHVVDCVGPADLQGCLTGPSGE